MFTIFITIVIGNFSLAIWDFFEGDFFSSNLDLRHCVMNKDNFILRPILTNFEIHHRAIFWVEKNVIAAE